MMVIGQSSLPPLPSHRGKKIRICCLILIVINHLKLCQLQVPISAWLIFAVNSHWSSAK
jgi:hypothetical protein